MSRSDDSRELPPTLLSSTPGSCCQAAQANAPVTSSVEFKDLETNSFSVSTVIVGQKSLEA